MQKHLSIVAAAALTVGTFGIGSVLADQAANPNAGQPAGQTAADSAQRAGDNSQTAAEKAAAGQGIKGTAQAPDAEGIRDVLASSTEAAFTSGGFDDLVERFVDADRNRIGKAMPNDEALKPMNDQIKAFRDAWKAKYGKEFDIDNEEMVFNDSFQIQQGEIQGDARTAGERQSSDASGQSKDNKQGDRAVLGNADLQTAPNQTGPRGGQDLTQAADQDLANRRSGNNISGSSNASTNSESTKVAGVGGTQDNKTSQNPSGASASGTSSDAGASGTVSTPAGDASGSVSADTSAARNAADRTGDAAANAADRTKDAAGNAADRAQQATGVDRPGSGSADANTNDPGRNIATVQIPESHGLPALSVKMIHEFPDAWRIDVPDTVDAAKLQANLTNVVNLCMQNQAKWPADVNEAYRTVGHKVLAAIHDKPLSASTGAGAGASVGQ